VTVGVVEMGDLDDKRSTGAPTARWTISMRQTEACRVLEETIPVETKSERATIAGSRATLEPTAFTTNEQRKHQTEFAKAQH